MNNVETRMNDEKEMWSGNPRRSKNEVYEISERVDHHYNAGPVAEVTDFPGATEITCAENCASGAVPHGTQSKTGTKKIKIPDLVSMWKYMLSPKYANRRLALYTFLNKCLRRGQLSEIVGFRVMNRVINRDACNFTGVNFWKIDREEFYADVRVELKLRSSEGEIIWNGVLVCWCFFAEKQFSMSVEELAESVDRKAEGLVLLSPFLVPYHTNQMMDV